MKSTATTVQNYINTVPSDKKQSIVKLRDTINTHIPDGFVEQINCGVIGRVVPKSTYPAGYHTSPEQPLPFVNLAAQKNYIALYHFALYSDPALSQRFQSQYPKHATHKLDMGKSCIRFKHIDDIPYDLIGQLISKMSVQQRIHMYENAIKK